MYDLYEIYSGSNNLTHIRTIVKRVSEDKLQIFDLNENKLIGDPFRVENFHKEKDVFVYETIDGNIEKCFKLPINPFNLKSNYDKFEFFTKNNLNLRDSDNEIFEISFSKDKNRFILEGKSYDYCKNGYFEFKFIALNIVYLGSKDFIAYNSKGDLEKFEVIKILRFEEKDVLKFC